MKLPEFNRNTYESWELVTEPDQAIDLKTIIYRVSTGNDTGLARAGLQLYGEEDGDDPYYNGMTQDLLEVLEDKRHLDYTERRMKFRERIINLKRDEPSGSSASSTENSQNE